MAEKTFSWCAALLSGMLCIAGCAKSAERLQGGAKSPEMQAAISKERIGDMDGAIKLYRETIDKYTDSSLANLQLALLLHEYKKDYVGAIYHYRRYIDTATKRGQRDFEIISNRIEKVEQLLSAYYVRKVATGDPAGGVQLMKNYADLDRLATELKNKNALLVSSNETLLAQTRRLQNKIDRQSLWIKRIQSSPAESAGGNGRIDAVTVRDADGNEKVLQTYEVRQGDSLSLIAEYVYGDRTLWPRIRDANPDKVRKGEQVKAGDVLIIP